jgi:Sigma-70 region 2.
MPRVKSTEPAPKKEKKEKKEKKVVVKKPVVKKQTRAAATGAPKKNYINNARLMAELRVCREKQTMTNDFAVMMMTLVERYAKHPDYSNIYSYKEDMQAFALMTISKVWGRFDPEKGSNPFAYFTQCIKNAFYQYLNHEKKMRVAKNKLKIDMGMNPSAYMYMENHGRNYNGGDGYTDYEGHSGEDDLGLDELALGGYDMLPGEVIEINYEDFLVKDDSPDLDAPVDIIGDDD